MGSSLCADYKEASPLKLGAEHLPFPCSLRELVLDRYGETPGAGSNAHPMQANELVQHLREIDDFSISPWIAIIEKAEAIGDPATPSREHTAVLRWQSKAQELWEKQFPLDGRVATQVRRLKPLSAALAILDPSFMQPGAHPLHLLMDAIQVRAIGWQSRLDRVGALLEQQVTNAIDQSRCWFQDESVDFTKIFNEFSETAARDRARAQRMVRRVVEAESGKVRTSAAKQEAARMINAALEKYPATQEIGDFVKEHWYTSAQLLLLKFGANSEQWEKMSITTETLLDSLQSLEEASDERRQQIFEVVTQLPKDMRRWLLSLHHDTEAVNEAMGLVEYAHLRILRGQAVELQWILPIEAIDDESSSARADDIGALNKWQEGQWFLVDQGNGKQRMQLVLKNAPAQQLLFANMAGIKALELSYTAFSRLMSQRKMHPLEYNEASFSLCLAQAAGVDSVEILDALASAMGVSVSDTVESPEPERTTKEEIEELISENKAGQNTANRTSHKGDSASESQVARPAPQQPEIFEVDLEDDLDFTTELVDQQSQNDIADAIEYPRRTAFDEESQRFIADDLGAQDETPQQDSATERKISLPMGVWIGFHDGETPMMARLAVHDIDHDNFIFVNRKGVKIRQASHQEMLRLIDAGLLEIVETKSNFKEAVTEIRKKMDH